MKPSEPRPPLEHRRRPCQRCPWRRDCDLTGFTDADFAKLTAANGRPRDEAGLRAPMMSCHLDQPDTTHAMRLCAGWLVTVGPDHLAVRCHVLGERLPEDALAPGGDWPALYSSLEELLAHRPGGQPPRQRSGDRPPADIPGQPGQGDRR